MELARPEQLRLGAAASPVTNAAEARPTRGRRTIQTIARRAVLAAASSLVALAAAEISLRVLGFAQITEFVPDERWGYLPRPSQTVFAFGQPLRINERGLRGPFIPLPKLPDVERVVFVGDSVTYGGGRIREEDLFCRVVEALALRDGLRAEAVNLSAPGWSPQNWRAYVEANGLLDADVVVMVLPAIDLERPFATMERHGLRRRAPLLRLESCLIQMLAFLRRPQPYAQAEADAAAEANLRAVRALRERAERRPFHAVWIPFAGEPGDLRRWAPVEAELPDALDLRRLLRPEHFQDRVHLSQQGHRFVGERLYERLRGDLRRPLRQPSSPGGEAR